MQLATTYNLHIAMHQNTAFQLLLLTFIWIPFSKAASKLPPEYKLCKRNDPKFDECLKVAVNDAYKHLATGIPSLNVPTFDPVKVPVLEIAAGDGPISLKHKFTNLVLTGLSDTETLELRSDLAKPTLMFTSVATPILNCDCELDGRVFEETVKGKGRCKLKIVDLSGNQNMKGTIVTIEGKNYLNTTEFDLDLKKYTNIEVNYDVFDDKAKGDRVNALLNENHKELWKGLEVTLEKAFGLYFLHTMKQIFDNVPLSDIFLE